VKEKQMNLKKLITKISEKDQKAFEDIYRNYHKLIYYVIYKMVGNKDDTRELVQDVFVEMYNHIDDFKGGNFKYWLVQIAKNHTKNYLSRDLRKKQNAILNSELVERIPDTHSVGQIDELLSEYFSQETKQIIILKVVFDYSFSDIAEEMDLNKSYVYRSYKASLQTLKLIMEK
jgi:RNA polymerase sigma-70 factor (ECF subfamily)